MAYTNMAWASVNVANAASNSGTVDLGRIYDKIQIEIPTMDATSINIAAARSLAGTYYALKNEALVDVSTGNTQQTFNIYGNQFLKVTCNNAQTANRTLYYRGIAD